MKEELLQFPYEKLIHSADFGHKIEQLNMELDIFEMRRFFAGCKPIRGMFLYFGEEDIQEGSIALRDNTLVCLQETLVCDAFRKFHSSGVKSVMMYLISCDKESYESYREGEMNYHFVQNCCIDMVREMLMQNFKMLTKGEYEQESELWFSRGFGPGYFGMELNQGRKLHKLLRGERIGVTYRGDMMEPLKSSIGITLSYQAKEPVLVSPCGYCKASNKDCLFCGEYKK